MRIWPSRPAFSSALTPPCCALAEPVESGRHDVQLVVIQVRIDAGRRRDRLMAHRVRRGPVPWGTRKGVAAVVNGCRSSAAAPSAPGATLVCVSSRGGSEGLSHDTNKVYESDANRLHLATHRAGGR